MTNNFTLLFYGVVIGAALVVSSCTSTSDKKLAANSSKTEVDSINQASFPQPVAFADITLSGELAERAHKNFDRLEEEKYQPHKVFLTEKESNYWPGDTEGRTVLALTLLAQATQRDPKYLPQIMNLFPQKMNEKGYFGTLHPDSVFSEQQLASHGWVLRSLSEQYHWKKDPETLKMIENVVNNLVLPTKGFHEDYPIDPAKRVSSGSYSGSELGRIGNWLLSTDTGCDFILLDGLTQAYNIMPSPALQSVVEEMINRFLQMDLVSLKAQTHASLTAMRALLRYYEHSRKPELLQAVANRYGKYRTQAMTENYENYNWFGRPEWTEPCAVIDSYITAVSLWRFTGEAQYLEDAHHIFYNGMNMEQRANGGFGLQNCSGAKGPFVEVSLDEAHWCCSMRGGEGLSRAIQYAFFTEGKEGILLPFYQTGDATLRFGNQSITLSETTSYPYAGTSKLVVKASDLSFAPQLKLFAPEWMVPKSLTLNGKNIDFKQQKGFVVAKANLPAGSVLELAYDVKSRALPAINQNTISGNYRTLRYGPLVLGYEGKGEVTLAQEPELVQEGENKFTIKGTNTTLSPIRHQMSPEVTKDKSFNRQILFKVGQ